MSYVSLHNHTCYSNLRLIDCINKPEDLIDTAYKLGLKGVAITDHESLSCHVKALEYWKANYQDKDFKLILGNEIYLTTEGMTEATYNHDPFYHLILLAKDEIGYRQIRELSSRAWQRGFFRVMMRVFNYPSDLFDVIGKNPGHVVCSTACLGGYIGKMVDNIVNFGNTNDTMFCEPDKKDFYIGKVNNFLNMLSNLFGKDNFYIELQPSNSADQVAFNRYMIINYWGKYPFIFTTDSHYLVKSDRELHKAFLNSKQGDREVDAFYSATYLMGMDEVKEYFNYISPAKIEEMVANTNKIGDMCEPVELARPQVLPKIEYEDIDDNREVFDSIVDYEIHPYFKHYRFTEDESDQYFFKLVSNGWVKENIDSSKNERYIEEMEIELEAIREISLKIGVALSDYFTTMTKIIEIIWYEADSLIGPSRGSAGAFLINYLLGITQMNPMEQPVKMASWRFLAPERPELPDIDFDTESAKRLKVFNKVRDYFENIGGEMYNICTFGTLGSKNALRTAARGLNIPEEVVNYLVSMIPNERGFDWTLKECYFGNGEDRNPIGAFVEEMDQYPQLWELAQKIEGLVTSLSVHASGVVMVNGDFLNYNSVMKTSHEQLVTAYDLHDSEKCGLVKYDMLTVAALDRIRQCFNYLLENHEIDWQGDLKSTYDKYLNPKVLDYTSKEMWDMVGRGEITELFQFDTAVGSQAIKSIKPASLMQLAVSNAIMRLQCDGELPLDTYVRFKNNIDNWYSEMTMYGLNEHEIEILEKYLLPYSGVAGTQEVVMELSMDPEIANFTMAEANKLRKTIAKKQFDKIEEVHQLFLTKGRAQGTSDRLLNYIWNVQVSKSLGYSFSIVHTTGYSILAVQEMNLAYKYPTIYWNCACLSADASAMNEADFDNLLDEGVIEISDEEDIRETNKTDYAKIITAINRFKDVCHITTPDINKSKLGFMPDADNNTIIYGLRGITRITSPVIAEIMNNRPYTSLQDFCNKVTKRILTRDKIVYLIKAGCFNEIEHKSVREILKDYILSTCDQKKNLTLQNANMLIDKDMLPEDLAPQAAVFKLTKALRKHKTEDKAYYIISEECDRDLLETFTDKIDVETMQLDNDRVVEVVNANKWDSYVYNPNMTSVKSYINDHKAEMLATLNNMLFMEDWNKYCLGDELQWELDAFTMYRSGTPLDEVGGQLPIEIDNVNDLCEDAVDGFFMIQGKKIPRMHLYTLIGTVLQRDTTKGVVTLQTPGGVINMKLYKDLFAFYNNETNGGSYFEKGTHLLVTGIVRGSMFIPKVYKNTGRKSILKLILDENNNFASVQGKEEDAN